MREPVVLNAVFQALADEKRRDMVALLAGGARSVSDLAAPLGLRLPSAVKHLAVLQDSGLVMSRKTGRVRTFALNPGGLGGVSAWIAARETALTAAFDRLDLAITQFPEEPE